MPTHIDFLGCCAVYVKNTRYRIGALVKEIAYQISISVAGFNFLFVAKKSKNSCSPARRCHFVGHVCSAMAMSLLALPNVTSEFARGVSTSTPTQISTGTRDSFSAVLVPTHEVMKSCKAECQIQSFVSDTARVHFYMGIQHYMCDTTCRSSFSPVTSRNGLRILVIQYLLQRMASVKPLQMSTMLKELSMESRVGGTRHENTTSRLNIIQNVESTSTSRNFDKARYA